MLTPMVEPSGAALAIASVPRLPLAPGLVVDDHRLAGALGELVADDAGDDVGRRARAVGNDDAHRALGPVGRGRGLRRGGAAGGDQGQCGRGATKRKKSDALHSGNLLRSYDSGRFRPLPRTAPMTAEPPAAASDDPRPLARLAARQGRDPGPGAALHPQVPRQDDRHQVRRQRDDRPGAAAGLRRGRRAAEAGRHEPGRRPRRRAADRGGARQDRQEGRSSSRACASPTTRRWRSSSGCSPARCSRTSSA